MSAAHIISVPKLYLDTNHLIEIARIRHGTSHEIGQRRAAYEMIDECITNRHFGVVLNDFASIEWTENRATLESALELAAVIDSAKLQYHYHGDRATFTWEVLKECQRLCPGIVVPEYELLPLRQNGGSTPYVCGIIENMVPGYIDKQCLPDELKDTKGPYPTSLPVLTARYYANHAFGFKQRRPDMCRERIEGFAAGLNGAIDRYEKTGKITTNMVLWMREYLKIDLILRSLNPSAAADALMVAVDISRCAGVDLWFRAMEKRIRAKQKADENDADDWFFVPLAPYVDLMLTERNLRGFMVQADRSLQAKVTHDPGQAVEILQKWL